MNLTSDSLSQIEMFVSSVSDCKANIHKGCKDAVPPCTKVTSQSLQHKCALLPSLPACLVCLLLDTELLEMLDLLLLWQHTNSV